TLVVFSFVLAAGRLLRALYAAPLAFAAKLPIALAFANLLAAGGTGWLAGLNKSRSFLPCSQLEAVAAHAHLAAVGWATMMVIGAGQRLLPMMLPAAMPAGARLLAAPILLEVGLGGLYVSLLWGAPLLAVSALAIAAGLLAFVAQMGLLLKHGRPVPSGLRRPDWGVAHALQSLCWLAMASVLGLFLALAPASEATLRATMAYGVVALVGFLAQMIVGVEGRLLPLAAWLWAYAGGGYAALPPAAHPRSNRTMQAPTFACWTAGVPLLAFGLSFADVPFTRAGGVALLTGVLLAAANVLQVLLRAKVVPAGGLRVGDDRAAPPPRSA